MKKSKKLFVALMAVMLVACMMPVMAFADVVDGGWSAGAKTDGSKITISKDTPDGAFSYQMKGDSLTAEGKTYEAFVNLSKDYEYGELFCTSLGFGTDANTYSTEFSVMTQKTSEGFVLTAGVAPGQKIEVKKAGVYSYQWTVDKKDGVVSATFKVLAATEDNSVVGELKFDLESAQAELNSSNCVRYLWAFGRQVGDNYVLDRDLVLYDGIYAIDNVAVVDGEDGFTPVETPKAGQKLTANVNLANGEVIGSYPLSENLEYVWSYADSDTVLGTDPVYTVTSDNQGKKIVCTVTGKNNYVGEVSWTAAKEVGHGEFEIVGAKEATCTEDGYTGDKVCVICGEILEAGKIIEATGHDFKDGICAVCGAEDPNYNPGENGESTTPPTDNPNPPAGGTTDDPADKDAPQADKADKEDKDAPKTGDATSAMPFVLLVTSLAAAGSLIALRKREE